MLDFSVTLVITVINIVFLTFILRLVLFKPLKKFMEERASRIRDDIARAESEKQDAQKLAAQYRDMLKNAEAEADAIIAAARKKAESEAVKIIDSGKAGAQAAVTTGRKQLEAEHQAMLARFKLEAAALVMAAASALAQKEISGGDTGRYAQMLLEELSARKGNG